MEMTRGQKCASVDCYKALEALVRAIDAELPAAFVFRDDEENELAIAEARRALSYYRQHGVTEEEQ